VDQPAHRGLWLRCDCGRNRTNLLLTVASGHMPNRPCCAGNEERDAGHPPGSIAIETFIVAVIQFVRHILGMSRKTKLPSRTTLEPSGSCAACATYAGDASHLVPLYAAHLSHSV
jgi:hypothetical protein